MLFNTVNYFLFLGCTLVLYYSLPKKNYHIRLGILLGASYFFYLNWQLWYIFLILPITLINYVGGILLNSVATVELRKRVFWLTIFFSLAFLAVFKYTDFLIRTINIALTLLNFEQETRPLIHELPIGISFFTFQSISYTIDVYKKDIPPEKNVFRFALYVSFFPQLVAGPIEKAKNLLCQLDQNIRKSVPHDTVFAIEKISYGLFKKVVIADNIGPLISPVFASPDQYSGAEISLAALLFSLQIYCDFSGYTDIAIGSARLFGIRLLENFHFPYFSANITQFWRRWHISLSSWLKEYLYQPLGGNRHGDGRMIYALLATMLLGGLWHGPSWNFVLWGGCHGIYLIVHKFWQRWTNKQGIRTIPVLLRPVFIAFTFTIVTLTWIPFVCTEFKDTLTCLSRIFSMSNGDRNAFTNANTYYTLALCSVFIFFECIYYIRSSNWLPHSLNVIKNMGIIDEKNINLSLSLLAISSKSIFVSILAILIILFSSQTHQQFIYFSF